MRLARYLRKPVENELLNCSLLPLSKPLFTGCFEQQNSVELNVTMNTDISHVLLTQAVGAAVPCSLFNNLKRKEILKNQHFFLEIANFLFIIRVQKLHNFY